MREETLKGYLVIYQIYNALYNENRLHQIWIVAYTKRSAMEMVEDWLINIKKKWPEDFIIEKVKLHKGKYPERISQEYYQKELELIYGGIKP